MHSHVHSKPNILTFFSACRPQAHWQCRPTLDQVNRRLNPSLIRHRREDRASEVRFEYGCYCRIRGVHGAPRPFSAHTRAELRIVILPKSQIANRSNCGPRPPHSTARRAYSGGSDARESSRPQRNKASSAVAVVVRFLTPGVRWAAFEALTTDRAHLPARVQRLVFSHPLESGNWVYRGNLPNVAVIHNDCSTGSGGTACPTRI